jgi:hypothetical protein
MQHSELAPDQSHFPYVYAVAKRLAAAAPGNRQLADFVDALARQAGDLKR